MVGGTSADLVALGEIMGAHGIHGQLKVKLHNPDSELLFELERVFVVMGDQEPQERKILDVHLHGKGLLMRLSGVNDRDQARALFGAQLSVPRDQLPEPEDDEFYLVDAIGARVVRPDGSEVGVVESFRAYPTADVLCVRCPDGLREVPLLPPYLVSADVDEGRVVVDHVDDLPLEPEPGRK